MVFTKYEKSGFFFFVLNGENWAKKLLLEKIVVLKNKEF